MSLPIVQIEDVRLTKLHQSILSYEESTPEVWLYFHLAIDTPDTHARAIANVARAVIGDVKVQRAVPIHVGQCHCHAAKLSCGSGSLGNILEMSLAIIQKTEH